MEELLKAREERSTHIQYLMSKNEYKTINTKNPIHP